MKLKLKNKDKVALVRGGIPYNYTLGSSASYALEYNECPIKAYESAIKNGHACYWLNQDTLSLTSGGTPSPVAKHVIHIGSEIYFEGKNFEIYAQANNNLGLKEI
tara:strand:- start:787 stop:1101 length:315 start_codon:yes stop_codon:yes gene_type:complete